MRVVVVGAGIAGIVAATELQAGGADVVVLEASTRLGGRARTVRDVFAGGQYVESGAEWIDTDHERMLRLIAEHGMSLLGAGETWTMIRRMLFRSGRLFGRAEIAELDPHLDEQLGRYEEVLEDIGRGIVDPARPQDHPQALEHDARSLADVAVTAELGSLAQLFQRRNSQGEFAEEPGLVSSLFVAQQRAQMAKFHDGGVRAHRLDGGLDTLIGRMAAGLREGTIRCGEAVHEVRWDHHGVEVVTDRGVDVADRVVLACSLVAVRSMRFDPPLPGPLARAVAELGYGTVTKTATQFDRRTWPAGYATTESVAQRAYEPTIDQPGTHGVLMSYAGGDGGRALADLPEHDRRAIVLDDLRSMYGDLGEVTGGFSRAWSSEPRYGGSYAVYRPGQVTAHWQVLRDPCGPIHLAGEHVATWTGYLEGAAETGERVARRLLGADA
jgi:monoamine oxidase